MNPRKLNAMFNMYIRTRGLRSSDELILEKSKMKTKLGDNNIRIRGANSWSLLDKSIRSSPTLNQFKTHIKTNEGFYTAA